MRASRGHLRVLGLTLALSSSAAFSLNRPTWLASSSPFFSGPPPPFGPHEGRSHPPPPAFHHDSMGYPHRHSRGARPHLHHHTEARRQGREGEGAVSPGPWEDARPLPPLEHASEHRPMEQRPRDVGPVEQGEAGEEGWSGARVVVVGMRRPLTYHALRGGRTPLGHTEDQVGGVTWSPWSSVLAPLLLSPSSPPLLPYHDSQRTHRLSSAQTGLPDGFEGASRDGDGGCGGVRGWIVAFLPRTTDKTPLHPQPVPVPESGMHADPEERAEVWREALGPMPPPPMFHHPPPPPNENENGMPPPPPHSNGMPPPPPRNGNGMHKGFFPPPPPPPMGAQGQHFPPPPPMNMDGPQGDGSVGPPDFATWQQQQQQGPPQQQQGQDTPSGGPGGVPLLPLLAVLVLGAVVVGVVYQRRRRSREQAHSARLAVQHDATLHTSALSAPLLVQSPSAPLAHAPPSVTAASPSLLQLPDGAYALLE